MDPNILIGIAGVITTLVLGCLGIRLSRGREKRVRLRFTRPPEARVPDSAAERPRDAEIRIKYRNRRVRGNAILLKASIVNNGLRDIDRTLGYRPLTIRLSRPFKWLDARIVKSSGNLRAECSIQADGSLCIDWDRFKKNESITLVSLIGSNGSEARHEELDFEFD